jgi:hypothetical protein
MLLCVKSANTPYLWLVLPFWEKIQFQITGKVVSSVFSWGDADKKEHRQWTGPGKGGVIERGKGGKGAKGEKETTQEEEKGRRTKSAWTSERVRKIIQDASVRWMGKPVHIKHQCVAADCHCHITAILSV